MASRDQDGKSRPSERMEEVDEQKTMNQLASKDQKVTKGFSQRMEEEDGTLQCTNYNLGQQNYEYPQTSTHQMEEVFDNYESTLLQRQKNEESNMSDQMFDEEEKVARQMKELRERKRKSQVRGESQRQAFKHKRLFERAAEAHMKGSTPIPGGVNGSQNELWKCKVAMTLTVERCVVIKRLLNLKIELSDTPGLDIIDEVEMRDLQGEDWQDFLLVLQQAGCHESVKVFKTHYPLSKTEKVSSRPYNYQELLRDLANILPTPCARYLATFFMLPEAEKERVKHGGASVLLDILQTRGHLTPENTQDFLHALKELDFNKAAKRIEEYQRDLQCTTIEITLNLQQTSSSSQNDEMQNDQTVLFETVTKRVTDPSQRISEESPLAKIKEHFKETYSESIYDTREGCIKIRLTVKKVKSLKKILADITSGKLSQKCSKILFPDEELPLEITFDLEEVESVYAQLKEIHAVKNYAVMEESKSICEDTYTESSDYSVILQSEQMKTLNIIEPSTESSYCGTEVWLSILDVTHFGDTFPTAQSSWLLPYEMHSELHELHTGVTTFYEDIGDLFIVVEDLSLGYEQKSPTSSRDYDLVTNTKGKVAFSELTKYTFHNYATEKRFIKSLPDISDIEIQTLICDRFQFTLPMTKTAGLKNWIAVGFKLLSCQMRCDERRLPDVSSSESYTVTPKKSTLHNQREFCRMKSTEEQTTVHTGSSSTDDGECLRMDKDVNPKQAVERNIVYFNECILHYAFWIPSDNYGPPRLDINDSDRKRLMSSFENICPNQGVNRVPAIPQIHKAIKVVKPHSSGSGKCVLSFPVSDEQLQELSVLSERQKREILRKRNFDRHVTTMADKLHRWASDMEIEMLILTNYSYQNYLREINSFVTGQNGEFDIIAISKDVGVIFIEVSSCQGNSPRVIKQQMLKNQNMLLRHKYVFLESNRDLLDFIRGIKVYQFSVFPNISAHVLNSFVCPKHSHNIMPKERYEDDNIFEWLNERVLIPPKPCLSVEQYQYLCIRYVGETSKVKVRTLHDAICITAKQLGASFLTKQQRLVVESELALQLLLGDCGTGKSLVLMLKAKHILNKQNEKNGKKGKNKKNKRNEKKEKNESNENNENNESKVCHIMCSSSFLHNCSEGQLISKHTVTDKNPGRLSGDVSYFLFHPFGNNDSNLCEVIGNAFASASKVHVFVHEVPLTYLEENVNFIKTLLQKIPERCSLWLSVTTQSKEEVVTIPNLYYEKFEVTKLTYYMKMPKRVINLYKALQGYVRHQFDPTETGHVIEGPEPILYLLTECRCNLDDAAIPTNTLSCECIVDRLYTVLHKLLQVLKDISPNKVAFYIHSHMIGGQTYKAIYSLIREAMSKMGVSVKMWQEITTQEDNSVAVVDDFRMLTDGKFVIVSIDPFGMNHWKPGSDKSDPHIPILSKCLSQYVHISWPKNEAIILHENELTIWENSVKKELGHPEVANRSNYSHKLDHILHNVKRLKGTGSDCLTYLLEGGYISPR